MTDRALQRTLLVLSVIGIGIAGYLSYIHYRGFDPACSTGGCERVQSSEWAKLAGVPVPYLGLVGYVGILASLFVKNELAKVATAGMAYIGFAFSMYLTYREIFTIEAICQWCVGSAVVMTLIAIVATIRVLRFDDSSYAPSVTSDPEHEAV
ncbi:vitamin K epoxide reductase family protein [Conexibacter woesei]|uniref:Vitamin K epoxide reductase n=1 Tax=Conexibacter woesei (strain DSM 14684 / CCUG 47730 / CIP 108061 / JCM 11494 / NBRC 100937 / ID131577) TaxID=469383 RepID=D3F2P1_CONWI|nr:vitamin K epoxide reductase family protein [Conexibacter woesei]ADB54172.1 Vitamin K epoxide reductase [Conexibacter woesei DSM 14684]